MNQRQKRFVDEYLIDCNAEQAAIRAGYSEKYARGNAHKLVANSCIRAYIDGQLEKMHNSKIANATEIMMYLTSVMRGESQGEIVLTVRTDKGGSEVIHIKKYPSEMEKLKAAEMLAKRYGLFKNNLDVEIGQVIIVDDLTE